MKVNEAIGDRIGVLVTFSVVLYKTERREFEALLNSVKTYSGVSKFYVVDNSPTACVDTIEHSSFEYIHRPENPGYGGGHNTAIRRAIAAGSQYHFVVNPDISFDPGVIETIIGFLESDREIGCLMPKVLDPEGSPQRLCRLLPTPADLFLRRFAPWPLKHMLSPLNDRYELRSWDQETVEDVPVLSGCFMAIRVSALERAGLFDERFFMYLEDFDLIRRLGQYSRTVFFPSVHITHVHRKESFRSFRMLFAHIDSAIRYFNKWGWFFDPYRKATNRRAVHRLTGAADKNARSVSGAS